MKQIVIKIDDEIYERFCHEYSDECLISKATNYDILEAFCNGTILPEHHGRLKDTDDLDETVFMLNTEKDAQITRNEYKIISNVLFEMPTILEATERGW